MARIPLTRRTLVVVASVAAVVVLVVVVALLRPDGATPVAGATASPSTSATASTSASATPSPTATATATPTPTATPTAPAESTAPAPAPTAATTAPGGEPVVTAPLESPATVQTDVVVSIGQPEAIEGDGVGPGEIDGPAIRFTVTVANSTAADASLTSAVVNAYFGAERVPGVQLSGSGSQPLPASVPAGGRATGVYVFLLPEVHDTTLIEVYSVERAAVAQFEGPTPS